MKTLSQWFGRHPASANAVAVLFVAWIACQSKAQNAAWVQPAGGLYEEPSNWVPSVVPGASNDILINVGAAYNIGFLSDHTANTLSISNNLDLTFSSGGPGTVERTFTLSDNATIDRATLTLGDLTQGRPLHLDIDGQLNMTGADLLVLNGAQLDTLPSLAASNTIEGAGGTASQVLVSGTDAAGRASRWASGGDINVGRGGGSAVLAVAEGGQVSSNGGVTVGNSLGADGSFLSVRGTSADGAPSSLTSGFFQLGFLSGGGGVSTATAQVADGAHATTAGVQVFPNSRVTVDREDVNRNPSHWDAETFQVFGGFVDVLGGGHITSDSLYLTRLAIAKVDGVGADGRPSRWDINGNLRLGNEQGFGSLLIDSGHVTSHTAQIGEGTGASLLSIDGLLNAAGVWENSGDVFVGGSTTGPEASGDLWLNDEHTRVDIGGTLTVWGPGTVRINGGEMKADVVDHTHGGTFDFDAGLLSVNRFDGVLQNVAGTFTPGVDDATGSTLINGDYTQQSGATLSIDIAGAGPGSTYDLVSITGDAQIDGLLELSLDENFTPDASTEFTVLAADSLIGFFDNVGTGQRLLTTDGMGSFVVHYGIGAVEEDRIILTDFQLENFLAADFDNDGDVDGDDFLVWQASFSVDAGGDADGDGDTDGDDFLLWQSQFGSGAGAANASVPEPTAELLLMLSLAIGFGFRCLPRAAGPLNVASRALATLVRTVATTVAIFFSASMLRADIVVDPDSAGANDVQLYLVDLFITAPLTNPVANPLDTAADELRIGDTGDGALLVSDGASVTTSGTTIGRTVAANGVLTVQGAGSTYHNNGTSFIVGDDGAGAMHVLDGGVVSDVLFGGDSGFRVAVQAQSSGSVVIDGTGSRLDTGGDVFSMGLGDESIANLTISNGGVAEVGTTVLGFGAENESMITVTGPASRLTATGFLFSMGNSGNNSRTQLRVLDGGTVVAPAIRVSETTDNTVRSSIVVDGQGSVLMANSISLGGVFSDSSTGRLFIANGGRVEVQDFAVFDNVDGGISSGLFVSTGGVLHVEDNSFDIRGDNVHFVGGTLSFGGDRRYAGGLDEFNDFDHFLGRRGGVLATGETLRVEGHLDAAATITLAGGTLSVGSISDAAAVDLNRGSLELTSVDVDVTSAGVLGDTIALGDDQRIAVSQNVRVAADGRIELEGGQLDAGFLENRGLITGAGRIDGALANEAGGVIRLTPMRHLTVGGGSAVNRGVIELAGSGALELESTLVNDGTIQVANGAANIVGDFENNGRFEINEGSEALVAGDAAFGDSSILAVELGEVAAGAVPGALRLDGTLALDGDVEVRLLAGFEPEMGDRFFVASAIDGISDEFDSVIQPAALPEGLMFAVDQAATSIVLEVVAATFESPADFDCDGDVDGDDFLVWQGGFGTASGAMKSDGDYDNDGDVDGDDFLGWQSEFGAGAGAASGSVPEPASALILALLIATELCWVRGRRGKRGECVRL